ncbi:MAG: hypothetical protein ACE37H_14745 [Phycisphaeraceae bacterium]
MNHDADQPATRRDGEPTPGLDRASARDLAGLLDAATDTRDDAPVPEPPRGRPRVSLTGVLFALAIAGVIGAVAWWSWQMADMGAQRLRAADDNPGKTPGPANVEPASPWLEATTDTIPTDGQTLVLEAVFNASADRIAVAFSDGNASVYQIKHGKLVEPRNLERARPYPIALRFDRGDTVELIRQDGQWLDRFVGGETQTDELDPPVIEVFAWGADLRVAAMRPFDGGLVVDRHSSQARLTAQRFLGAAPALGVVLTADRDDSARVGILEPDQHKPRFVSAPGHAQAASLSPDGRSLALALADGTVACIDANNGAVRWRRDPAPGIERPRLVFLPTGELVLAEHRLLLLHARDGQVLADLTPEADLPLAAFDLILSPDGRRLCVLGNDLLVLTRGD